MKARLPAAEADRWGQGMHRQVTSLTGNPIGPISPLLPFAPYSVEIAKTAQAHDVILHTHVRTYKRSVVE